MGIQNAQAQTVESMTLQQQAQHENLQSRAVTVVCRTPKGDTKSFSLTALGVRSVIDENVEIEGNIIGTSSIAIRGSVNGDVRVRGAMGLVVIFPTARITGCVRARYVWLAGNVKGRIECQRLLVLSGAYFDGEVVVESLEVKYGADYLPRTTNKESFDYTV